MENMHTISIIMPVYNVEKYLRQSIESVLNQTYKKLEIILVNDGSTDTSGKICEEYAKKDNRIKVIHKKNGGLSDARNYGLDNATGKYIMFIDSDDFFEEKSCELLYNAIENQNTDYVMGNYIYTTYEGKPLGKPMFDINSDFEVSINDYEKSLLVMNSVVWNKIFKREFIEKHNLRFIKDALSEDSIFSTYCYTHTDKGYCIKNIIYNYRQNKSGTTISNNCNKKFFEKFNETYKLLYNNFKSTDNLGFYRMFCIRIMPFFLCKIIDTDMLKNDEEIIYVLKLFDWYFKQKEDYNVIIINKQLNNIISDLNTNNYENALIKIKQTKEYRKGLTDIEKMKMYAVDKETLKKIQGGNDYCKT